MQAVVLAGNIAPEPLRQRGVERIYLLSIDGETLLERMCRCLIDGGGCTRVFVLSPQEVPLPGLAAVSRADYTGDVITDVFALLRDGLTAQRVFLGGADMPLITPEAVAAVRSAIETSGADAVYPVVERGKIEERFPGTKRTYLKLRTGMYSGGNVFALDRQWLASKEDIIRYLFDNRKKVVALIRRFGFWFLLRLLSGTADLPYIERHLGRVANAKLQAAALPFAELAVDLDKSADLDLFLPYLDPIEQSD